MHLGQSKIGERGLGSTGQKPIGEAGPQAVLVFASPLPAAGLTDVRVALAPTEDGFRIETEGGSLLGPFDGLVNLAIPEDGDVRIGIERGRKVRNNLKLGICGEHGGDPASVRFCDEVGLDYVSCSPYRVPIARLAAAQAALGGKVASQA